MHGLCQLDKIFYGWYKCLVLVRLYVSLKIDKYRNCIEGLHTLMYIKERRCSYVLYRLEESPGAHGCVHYTHSCAVLSLLIETRFQFFLVQGSYQAFAVVRMNHYILSFPATMQIFSRKNNRLRYSSDIKQI